MKKNTMTIKPNTVYRKNLNDSGTEFKVFVAISKAEPDEKGRARWNCLNTKGKKTTVMEDTLLTYTVDQAMTEAYNAPTPEAEKPAEAPAETPKTKTDHKAVVASVLQDFVDAMTAAGISVKTAKTKPHALFNGNIAAASGKGVRVFLKQVWADAITEKDADLMAGASRGRKGVHAVAVTLDRDHFGSFAQTIWAIVEDAIKASTGGEPEAEPTEAA